MNASSTIYEVVIVGAGPTGLTLANILGMHRVRTLLVERNAATVGEPRAVSIDDESLRTMQYIDLVDTVRSRIVEGYGSYYFPASRRLFREGRAGDVGIRLPAALRISAADTRSAIARRPEPFSERAGALFCAGRKHHGRRRWSKRHDSRLRWHSPTRCGRGMSWPAMVPRAASAKRCGIRMTGSTYDARWLIVDLAGSCERFRHTRVYCDPARPALALPGPEGTRRYEFMMLPGEKPEELLTEARVRWLLAQRSDEDAKLEIVRGRCITSMHASPSAGARSDLSRGRCGTSLAAIRGTGHEQRNPRRPESRLETRLPPSRRTRCRCSRQL